MSRDSPSLPTSSSRSSASSPTALALLSSTTGDSSVSNMLVAECVQHVLGSSGTVVTRDLSQPIPLLTQSSTAQLGVAATERTGTAIDDLAFADLLIAELFACEVVVIGAPIYNFGVPANLKAWADLVAQQDVTFSYDDLGGLSGLVPDRPCYVVVTSGGTLIDGPEDLGTPWLRQFLGFLGIGDVTVIAANGLAIDPDAGLAEAREHIARL